MITCGINGSTTQEVFDAINQSYIAGMEAKASALTAESFAYEDINTFVKHYYYDINSDTILFQELMGVYSAKHYAQIVDPNDYLHVDGSNEMVGALTVDDGTAGDAGVTVRHGTSTANIKFNYLELRDNLEHFRIESDFANQEIDFKINDVTSMSLSEGDAPKTPHLPLDVNHLTRKDYVDTLVQNHENRTDNPHTVTAQQVGTFPSTDFVQESNGSSDAGMPIVLNQNGQIDASMLDTSTFYPVAAHDPSDGTEYPDTTGQEHGAFWWVETLANPTGTDPVKGDYYEFTTDPAASIEDSEIASLLGKRIYIGDFMVWAATGWGIMAGEMNPTLYYKLDGSHALTAPFAGGNQQIKNIADGSDSTDACTMQQLSGKVSKSGDTMTGTLTVNKSGLAVDLKNAENQSSYIRGTASNGVDSGWYLGRGSSTKNDVSLNNYITNKALALKEDGRLTYDDNEVLTTINGILNSGGTMTGALNFNGVAGVNLNRDNATQYTQIRADYGAGNAFELHQRDSNDNSFLNTPFRIVDGADRLQGESNGTWTIDGSPIITEGSQTAVYGLLFKGSILNGNDLNNVTEAGIYDIDGGVLNTPPTDGTTGMLTVKNATDTTDNYYQIFEVNGDSTSTNDTYERRYYNDSWSSWTKIINSAGGTLDGQLKGITPVDNEDLTRKDYVDNNFVNKSGDTMTGQLIINNQGAETPWLTLNGDDNYNNHISMGNNTLGWLIEYYGAGTGNDNSLRFVAYNKDTDTKGDFVEIKQDCQISTTATAPVNPEHITRKDYVDGLVAPLIARIEQLESKIAQLEGEKNE